MEYELHSKLCDFLNNPNELIWIPKKENQLNSCRAILHKLCENENYGVISITLKLWKYLEICKIHKKPLINNGSRYFKLTNCSENINQNDYCEKKIFQSKCRSIIIMKYQYAKQYFLNTFNSIFELKMKLRKIDPEIIKQNLEHGKFIKLINNKYFI